MSAGDLLGYLLGQANLAHRRIAEEELSTHGLRAKEFGALKTLAAVGVMSQQRLGAALRIDRTTMVSVADELERKRLVERKRDPADRRAYALEPTARGREALRRAARAAQRAEARFLEPLSPADRQRFRELLGELVDASGDGS